MLDCDNSDSASDESSYLHGPPPVAVLDLGLRLSCTALILNEKNITGRVPATRGSEWQRAPVRETSTSIVSARIVCAEYTVLVRE